MRKPDLVDDDRGVSIAVTHVLTIGITAILISGLMFGAGSLLEGEKDRSAGQSLETIGERLSGEISGVDRLEDEETETLKVTVDTPRTVSGSQYTIEVENKCSHPLVEDDCLLLTSHGGDVEVGVPLNTDADVDVTGDSVTGGTLVLEYGEDTITIERESP